MDIINIYEQALNLYYQQGIRFTMNDLAKQLGISKRTLYETIPSKEGLIIEVIEHYFHQMIEEKNTIRCDDTLTLTDKLKKLLKTVPNVALEKYRLSELKKWYPKAYELINTKLTTGWEQTNRLLDEAKARGLIKDIDNELLISLYTSGVENLLLNQGNGNKTFKTMQSELVDMLLYGIINTPNNGNNLKE